MSVRSIAGTFGMSSSGVWYVLQRDRAIIVITDTGERLSLLRLTTPRWFRTRRCAVNPLLCRGTRQGETDTRKRGSPREPPLPSAATQTLHVALYALRYDRTSYPTGRVLSASLPDVLTGRASIASAGGTGGNRWGTITVG